MEEDQENAYPNTPEEMVVCVIQFYKASGIYPVPRERVVNLCLDLGAPDPDVVNMLIDSLLNFALTQSPKGLSFKDISLAG